RGRHFGDPPQHHRRARPRPAAVTVMAAGEANRFGLRPSLRLGLVASLLAVLRDLVDHPPTQGRVGRD
ncbi:MAG: hypothetical protein M3238_01760, partial [Actinomycetota bacterium]|nr:hypothetical protein [Actinomycetota bacterium]